MTEEERLELRKRTHFLTPLVDRFLNGDTAETEGARIGFVLMTFEIGDPPRCSTYISNMRREDVVMLLKEQIAALEHPQVSGRA
jgi:hypothetical protein